ncbi:sigma-70 family RNA polymerase sigma factor [Paenibacillus sp. NEAU-GSW1]|uniref:sigma-70 family RNA polymerase sigma factor n=1 Tax=Paenibacillus sp. NEAU-GSW1 TaxID=2682486 RepID=UPI0012E164D0|nr:sigma-70 family RNA polymerase sigma factor [Paenibacillus sp. NEAU-GSW1]MUT67462.1 sigma-70 family RNA polymerase sigma factor [Paenibacillus sp. NEAU-GSW1]
MKDNDWQPWLIRMSQGDEEAFRTVYEATRDRAYGLIYYLAPRKQDVGDIMNEVYIELLRSVDKYRPEQPFEAWFNGLIVRQVRNWKRKGWRLFRIAEKLRLTSSGSIDAAADNRLAAVCDRMALSPLLQKLPHNAREIIVLRYYKNCSLEEIASLLNIPLGTVKSRHHHALKKLRSQFDSQEGGKERNGYVYRI